MSSSIHTNNKNSKNNNKSEERKPSKSGKSVKAVHPKKSVPSCDCRAMHRMSTSSAPTLSPPLRNKSKTHSSSPASQMRTSPEEDIIDMPILTPEVPFDPNVGPPVPVNTVKPPSPDLIYPDLSAPPVLSPALDSHLKSKTNSNEKQKKRKSKAQTPKVGEDIDNSLFQLSDYNSDNTLNSLPKSPKKLKTSPKKSKIFEIQNKSKKINKNIFGEKSKKMEKEWNQSSRQLLKVLNTKSKSKPKLSFKSRSLIESNGWSVDSNHTLSSVNSSMQTSQPFMKYRNFEETTANGMDCAQNESLVSHNSSIFDNSFKFRQKLIKKSKTALNSQFMRAEANRAHNKSLFNELTGVLKPEPEVDEIEGIQFQSFESEESINLFSKFEQLEKEQREQSSISKTFGIKSLKSGKLIFPTKTKDITKIKGWREKLFSSLDEKHNKRPIGLSHNYNKNDKTYRSLISSSDTTIGQSSSSGSKSAFVSDILEGYLQTNSDLKLNYLSPDFAPPPDDSPIFSASVLRIPDFGVNCMPPPMTPSTSQTFTKKKNLFKTKGTKNKTTSVLDITNDSLLSTSEEEFREELLPQYPVISETLWPEKPLTDEQMSRLYNDYIEFTFNEMQSMKKPMAPSLVMDDNYARFGLSALQCNTRIPFINDSEQTSDNVLMAVGLAPTKQKTPSPVKEKITGRYRKDREADLAKIIAMGNRSKRQIRLPSRFHESSLLMGNQWIIPDYDQKGKTGKRRLQEEQRRLQELHQKQLEIEQRKQPSLTIETTTTTSSTTNDSQLSLIHKKLSNGTKSKLNPLNIPSVSTEYPLKIPHQRLKQIQLIRDQKKQMKTIAKQKTESQKLDKSFTSLFSMSTQGTGDKRVLSLSAKAAASANQRAQVNNLFLQLSEAIHPDKNSMICRNGKLNKLETIKDAIETIEKLAKREQQLCYIRKLLQMWNHKLQLCSKVAQKDLKPEAYKVVNDVMNTYKSSMCYKVGEALEAKRKEFQQKRAQQNLLLQQQQQQNISQPNANQKKPQLSTSPQVLTIPTAKATTFKAPPKALKPSNQRLILPKLPVLNKNLKQRTEGVISPPILPNIYPKLTTPDLHQKNVIDSSIDTDLIGKESSLLKPPILTTRPTVLKPFIVEGLHSSTSVTGPVINYPNITKIKSMSKSLNMSISSSSLIAPSKPSSSISSSSANTSNRLKLPFNSIKVPGTPMPTISMNSPVAPNSQMKASNPYSPHSYATKNMIITYESPKANEDKNFIVSSNDQTKKGHSSVRISNGRAVSIPGSSGMASTSKGSNIVSSPPLNVGSISPKVRNRRSSCETKDDSKLRKSPKSSPKSQSSNSSLNLSQNSVSKSKPAKVKERAVSSHSDSKDCID